ncbi:hypothetical protein NLX86_27230 [Streptomyces sp. A3M-1-3]|uniref:hypothetical protein n=1 Tax=Streptomyces sp. A3M-1-3 TaxID=2962044 RepID=UPI0020B74181|nr:hypothetical protein [Streptomyces sp. A3M-1-3]MCP3821652.1 hypothetical protein [Streptomyces sp. A3M-1-3]
MAEAHRPLVRLRGRSSSPPLSLASRTPSSRARAATGHRSRWSVSHFIAYPVADGTPLNFLAVVPDREWTVESWSTEGSATELLRAPEGWHPFVTEVIRAAGRPGRWALEDAVVLPGSWAVRTRAGWRRPCAARPLSIRMPC